MAHDITTRHAGRRVRREVGFRRLQVQAIEQLTPCMKRIVVGGDALRGFHSDAPDDHVKLFFPDEHGELTFPSLSADRPDYPQGTQPSAMRDFTARQHDQDGQRLVLDFVAHDAGAAAQWVEQARVGDILGVGGPRSSQVVADDFDHYVLIGDETALPAIGRWLEGWQSAAPIDALVEVPTDADRQPLRLTANTRISWLPRSGAPAANSRRLETALRSLPVSAGDTFYWIAAESRRARAMHRLLVEERGVPKEWVRATGYWQADQKSHPDHA